MIALTLIYFSRSISWWYFLLYFLSASSLAFIFSVFFFYSFCYYSNKSTQILNLQFSFCLFFLGIRAEQRVIYYAMPPKRTNEKKRFFFQRNYTLLAIWIYRYIAQKNERNSTLSPFFFSKFLSNMESLTGVKSAKFNLTLFSLFQLRWSLTSAANGKSYQKFAKS